MMSKMSRKFMVFIITAAVLFAANSALAEPLRFVRKINKEKAADMYQRLKLTEEQKRSLEKNRNKHHGRLKSSTNKVHQLKQEINKELQKPDFNQQKVKKLKAELNSHQSNLNNTRVEGIMNVREILTPEQYELFQNLTD